MESESAGCSSGGVMNDVCSFNLPEIVGDPLGPSAYQNFINFEANNANMVFVRNSNSKKEASYSCNDANLTELTNVKHVLEENTRDPSEVYLSTGIYIHPLSLNGNYENIIELIDVDPNEKLDVGSPLPNNENVLDSQPYDMTFDSLLPINENVVSFFHNYTKIPRNGGLQSLQMVYNSSENNNLNHKKIVPPFLKRNRKPKSVNLLQGENNTDDDDVVFVKEWVPELPDTTDKCQNSIDLATIDENNVKLEVATTSSSSSSNTSTRRRRRRRTFGEKRKNPVRKAQIEKASMDLAEKLAIPPSVFNARVKGRKPKQKTVVETKNLRQSCRTTGAILSPPRTLTDYDYKEWPVDGMHERPFYDETTNTIIKYHIPNTTLDDNVQFAGTRPVLSELTAAEENNCKSPRLFLKSTRKASKKTTTNVENAFAMISSQRLQLMLGYVKDLKEFTEMTINSSTRENTLPDRKPTVYEKSLEFRQYQNGIKEKKIKNEAVKKAQAMLSDACTLYSLAQGVSRKEVSNLINNYANTGKNWVRPQI